MKVRRDLVKKLRRTILLTTTLACLAVSVVPDITSVAFDENTLPSAVTRFAQLSEQSDKSEGLRRSERVILAAREGRGGGGRGSRGGGARRGSGGMNRGRRGGAGVNRGRRGGAGVNRGRGGRRWDGRRDRRWDNRNGRRWNRRDGRRRWDGRWDTRNRFDYRTRQRIAWGYPLTFFDIVALSRSGVGYGDIVYYVDSTNTSLCLTDADRDYLEANGVSPDVIWYLESRCGTTY